MTHIDRERGIVTIGAGPGPEPKPTECDWYAVKVGGSFLSDPDGRLLTYPRHEAQKAMLELLGAYGRVELVPAPDGCDNRMLRVDAWAT